MDFNKVNLESFGFKGFIPISHLMTNRCTEIPKEKGVYLVAREISGPPVFLRRNPGGHYRGDPTEKIDKLKRNWIEGAYVLYIGQSGGGSSEGTLFARVCLLMDFGKGMKVRHWGGRYIWQLGNSDRLLVAWKSLPDTDPETEKARLIEQFKLRYGRRPFANLKDGRRLFTDLTGP